MRKIIIKALIIRKMARPRRIVNVVTAALSRASVADQGIQSVVGCEREMYTAEEKVRGVVVLRER